MKPIIAALVLVLATWVPGLGFAAPNAPCDHMSGQATPPMAAAHPGSCEHSAAHRSGGGTVPLPFPCQGGAGNMSCSAAILPSAPMLLVFHSVAVYHPSVDYRFALFIPEQLHRPPVVS